MFEERTGIRKMMRNSPEICTTVTLINVRFRPKVFGCEWDTRRLKEERPKARQTAASSTSSRALQ